MRIGILHGKKKKEPVYDDTKIFNIVDKPVFKDGSNEDGWKRRIDYIHNDREERRY